MSGTLTIAGIKFCIAILGVSRPSYDDCNKAMHTISITVDRFWRGPTINGSMPKPFKFPIGYKECIEWAEYDIFDGSKGTSYFCWRPAKFIFNMDSATFYWEFE